MCLGPQAVGGETVDSTKEVLRMERGVLAGV